MRRTTTPTYIFTFPFNISAIDKMTITFAQGSRKIVKTKTDGTIEDTKFSLTLTQEETKYFCDGNCKIQIKLASGRTVLASTIFEAKVRSILDDTVFTLPDPETEDEQTEEIATQAVPISAIEGAEVLIDEIPQEFVVTFTEAVLLHYEIDLPLDYANDDEITNKPSINGHEIVGELRSADLDISASDIGVDDSSEYWSSEFDNAQEALDILAEDTYKAGNNANTAKRLVQDHTTDISHAPSDYSSDGYHVKKAERIAWNAKQNALSNDQMNAVNSGITSGKVQQYDNDHTTVVRMAIELQSNYATKTFVNSSIATNTANFYGTFDSVAELNAYSAPKTNNDYAYVIIYDPVEPTEVKQYDRYKYVASSEQWVYEYTLNNSSFTQAQWDAINSGLTSGDLAQIKGSIEYLLRTIAEKQDALSNDQMNAVNSGITQGKVQQYDAYANTLANKEDASNKTTIIDAQSTNTQYAGAKAVYDFVDGIVGNINSILATI